MSTLARTIWLIFGLGWLAIVVLLAVVPDAHAADWGRPTFPTWTRATVQTLRDPELPLDLATPGAIQPKKYRPAPIRRQCNRRTDYGYWLPVPCAD